MVAVLTVFMSLINVKLAADWLQQVPVVCENKFNPNLNIDILTAARLRHESTSLVVSIMSYSRRMLYNESVLIVLTAILKADFYNKFKISRHNNTFF